MNFVKPKEYDPEAWPKKAGAMTLKSTFIPPVCEDEKQARLLTKQPWRSEEWSVGPDTTEILYTYTRPEWELRHGVKEKANETLRQQRLQRERRKAQELTQTLKCVIRLHFCDCV